jgi:ribonuclease P/MRP protein subunit POP5
MVRIKHRYLLINILYPGPSSIVAKAPEGTTIPDVVQFHAPTSDKLNAQLLARIIRDGVGELFGDWGLGVIAGSLKGELLCPCYSLCLLSRVLIRPFPSLNSLTQR